MIISRVPSAESEYVAQHLVTLAKDQEVMLFLRKHEEGVYVGSEFYAAVQKDNNPNFKAELADVEKTLKVAADPMPALKGKEAEVPVYEMVGWREGQPVRAGRKARPSRWIGF